MNKRFYRRRLAIIAAAGAFAVIGVGSASAASSNVAWTKHELAYTTSASGPIFVYSETMDKGAKKAKIVNTKLPVSGDSPEISPNGTMVAYGVATPGIKVSALHFVNITTGVDVNTFVQCSNVVWAPDSSAVACDMVSPTTSGLITVTPSGQTTTIATNSSTSKVLTNSATWDPGSSTVAWGAVVKANGKTRAVLRGLKADGSGPLINYGSGSNPVWGSTGITYLSAGKGAVVSSFKKPDVSDGYLYSVNPDTGQRTSLLTDRKFYNLHLVGPISGGGILAQSGSKSMLIKGSTVKTLSSSPSSPIASSPNSSRVLVLYKWDKQQYGPARVVDWSGVSRSTFNLNHVAYLSASRSFTF